MKIERAWIGLLAAVQVVFAGPALAGGPTNQGVLFSGEGLDWQRTATETQARWHLPQPLPKTPFTVNAARFTSIGCTPVATGVARCRATVVLEQGHSPSKICGRWLDPKTDPQTIVLYAFNGYVEQKGRFLFPGMTPAPTPPGPNQVQEIQQVPKHPVITLACGLTQPPPPFDEWSALGALGKCMEWPNELGGHGYPPAGVTGGSVDLFESCLRMVRGDYCGDGVTHTKDSTLIDPYLTTSLGNHVVQPAFILEANWNGDGAICIIHARYVALPASCQAKFSVSLDVLDKPQTTDAGITGMRGNDYWCRKGLLPIDQKCAASNQPAPCPWFKQVKDLLSQGFLLNDSLLQP